MAKKVIIKESVMNRLIAESILNESNVSDIVNSNEFKSRLKDAVNDAIAINMSNLKLCYFRVNMIRKVVYLNNFCQVVYI